MMGTIRKKGSGYEAQVARLGVRKSKTFRTKAEANMWIAETEKGIIRGNHNSPQDKTFGDLLHKYGATVSVTKRGKDWELWRVKAISNEPIGKVPLNELNQTHFVDWRDRRLETVAPSSVTRDWNLISHALNIAVREWKWLHDNPIKDVRKPKEPPHRERRITQDEIDRLLLALGYEYNNKPERTAARVGAALLFAIETAMRAGEIVSLHWDNVDLESRVARLLMTKNGFPRTVPLSSEAIRILNQVRCETESVFNLSSDKIDSNFRSAKKRALIEDLRFHDSRAEAITRLSKKVDILTLARISGHRDLRMLQIYYRESMEDIAKRI
jgi:integrase